MQRISPIGKSPDESGFTLLELMLVVLIVGLLSSTVVLTLIPTEEDDAAEEAVKIQRFLRQIQQQAVFEGTDLGILFSEHRVVSVHHTSTGWQQKERPYLKLPASLSWLLEVEGHTAHPQPIESLPSTPPHLVFFSDGQYTTFQLKIWGASGIPSTLNGLFILQAE